MPPWDFFQKPSSCGLDKAIQISNITSSDKQHPYLIFWEQTFKRLSEACSLDIIFNFFLSSLSASRLERLDMNGWALELITMARNAYGFQCISARSHCIGITKIDCGLSGRFCGPLKKTSLQRRVLIFVKTIYFMMLLQEQMFFALHFNQSQNVI
jgi:hypothetical protein